MNRTWQQAMGTAAVGLALAASLSGCMGRPAPRPESPGVSPTAGTAVEQTAETVTGSGDAAAVVMGNVALVALGLEERAPGGTDGQPLTGSSHSPTRQGYSGGSGPVYMHGPGGSVGASPATPGGGINPGGAAPGGTPNSTQAITNGAGDLATASPGGTSPTVVPGAIGSAPMDVMIRVADQIRAKHNTIAEVRFAATPEDALRVAHIANQLKAGQPATAFADELNQLKARLVPAGTSPAPQTPEGGLPADQTP